MAKILGVDYGRKRCGLAETDDLHLIASAVGVYSPTELLDELEKRYCSEGIACVVVGQAVRLSGELSVVEADILQWISRFNKRCPGIPVRRQDERLTSQRAVQEMIRAGVKKSKRAEKGNVDKVSAVLILQAYLEESGGSI